MNNETVITKNNIKIEGVSVLEMKLKLEEILTKYDKYITEYKMKNNDVLSEQFLRYRPWIIDVTEKSVTINSNYMKEDISIIQCEKLIELVNKRELRYCELDDNIKKKKSLETVRIMERTLFLKDIDSVNSTSTTQYNQDVIRTINNGEFMFLTKSISSSDLKIKSLEEDGNMFNKNLKIVRECSNKFMGIHMTASYIDAIDEKSLPGGINFTSAMSEESKNDAKLKFESYYEDMSILPQMLYTICTAKYLDLRDKGLLIKGVYGLITLNEIHFTYRQLCGIGGNKDSIPLSAKKQYIDAFKQLEKYRISMEFNPNKMPSYYRLNGNKKNQTTVIDDQIFYIMGYVGKQGDIPNNKSVLTQDEYNDNLMQIEAVKFAFGEIGDIYFEQNSRRLQYNQNYPKSNLGLNPDNQKWAYRLANEMSMEHRAKYKKGVLEHVSSYSIQDLIDIGKPQITSRNFKRDINRYLQNQCVVALNKLIDSKIISRYSEIPTLTASDKHKLHNINISINFAYENVDY